MWRITSKVSDNIVGPQRLGVTEKFRRESSLRYAVHNFTTQRKVFGTFILRCRGFVPWILVRGKDNRGAAILRDQR